MAHLTRNKQKLLNRIRRIKGQVEAIEKALEEEKDCGLTLQTIAAARGAMNGLMAEVMEGHIREHILNQNHDPHVEPAQAAEELIGILRSYLK